MPFQIIRNDITKVTADAIVNTANPMPIIGGGTDSAVYKAAGEEKLLAERQKIGAITPGNAVSTPAFNLKAKYIIHTVGPKWIDGNHNELETLHACYANSLTLAAELSCESIAFPLISTGVYGFPKAEALDAALKEIGKFLLTHEMTVTLVVFDRNAVMLSKQLVGEINEYIDEHSVGLLRAAEFETPRRVSSKSRSLLERPIQREELQKKTDRDSNRTFPDMDEVCMAPMAPHSASIWSRARESLEELLSQKEDTFQERLFKLIDERKLDDVTVYKRANSNRKAFSKIRCNVNYRPKKSTAVAYAIALHLDMPAMKDLLSRAGFALTPGNKFDLIISYFVSHQNYDILEINTVLFEYDQPLLGEV